MAELPIGISGGGTGASTKANARTSFGLGTTDTVTFETANCVNSVCVNIKMTGNNPGVGKHLISDAAGNCTWQVAATGGGWVDDGTVIRLATGTDKVGIGTSSPDATLEVNGLQAGTVGGFVSGSLHIRSPDTAQFSNAAITGHNSFAGNTQLWYLGSVSSSNDDIAFINRQNGAVSFLTNNALAVTIEDDGDVVFEKQLQVKGGVPGLNKVLTSDANGLATWETANGSGWVDDGAVVRLETSTNDVVIGANTGFGAPLELVGNTPGTVGGFASGAFQVRSPSALINGNAVITGHNSFGGNKQLWYLGSTSSSNDNIAFINRQSGIMQFQTGGANRITIEDAGNVVFEQQVQVKGGIPGLNKVLTSDAVGLATWEDTAVIHVGGYFVDTTDQLISIASTPQEVTFNTNSLIDDIGHTAGSATFTINTGGVYSILVAPQLAQGSGAATVEFWIEKNGTDIVNSNVQETISANSQSLPILRWKERFIATDTFKVIWASNSVNTKLDNLTSAYGGPNIPSIMFGVSHIGS